MTSTPRIALVLSSTRPSRFADTPAAWIMEQAAERDDLSLEILDLRAFPMPFFEAPASDLWMPATDTRVIAWQQAVSRYDGFIFLTAEYNRSIPAVLKNALDQAYRPFMRKPMAVFSYGSVGGTRAAEHLRTIAIELQMVPSRFGVHLGGSEFLAVHPIGGKNAPMSDVEGAIADGTKTMFDDLVFWARTITPARQEATAKAA